MKRMKPQERKAWVFTHWYNLYQRLTCLHGSWNRDKLLEELEQKLRSERLKCGENNESNRGNKRRKDQG